ncbi:MAG: GT4 family glycosyltransferase PelF [Chloroflexota bacterium]|nr:GT4 family glycosyltransferase PelF [Chloroflexota bacterium]
MKNISVLLETEGTYPFVDGGVSTWCDILCHELPQVDFYICAITGDPYVATKYNIPPNVKQIIHVPLWGAEEPAEYVLEDVPFSTIFKKKVNTTDSIIEEKFLPVFRELLHGMAESDMHIEFYGQMIHRMYHYFKEYDYKDTLRSELVWRAFKDEMLLNYVDRPQGYNEDEWPSMFDITTCMRWLFNFLMPLNVSIPRTDISHATIAASVGLLGIIAKIEHGTPIIATDHGVYIRERYIAVGSADLTFFSKKFMTEFSAFVTKLNYLYADQISPVCNFNQRWELRWGATEAKVRTIYNGVDPDIFVPGEKSERTRDRPTVVAAARVFPLKDILTMIRSAAVVRESIPNVKYIVFGSLKADPKYVEECRSLIKELNLDDTFELAGFHSNPAQIFNEGDISILSSISEGFPYTVLESMSCATPVVGTDVGGVREALEGFGIVVKPKDPEALAEGVIRLLSDDELRQRLGRMAREEVLAKFRTSYSVSGYWETYQQLAETRGRIEKKECL